MGILRIKSVNNKFSKTHNRLKFQDGLKGTATLIITMFYMRDLNKP